MILRNNCSNFGGGSVSLPPSSWPGSESNTCLHRLAAHCLDLPSLVEVVPAFSHGTACPQPSCSLSWPQPVQSKEEFGKQVIWDGGHELAFGVGA
jgi:hypothetical protein